QSYKDMRNNQPLARRFGVYLGGLGVPFAETDPTSGQGSTDMGDVSYAVPSIHPYLAICDRDEAVCHHPAFTAKAASDQGTRAMLHAAKAMALTAYDVLADDGLRAEAKGYFARGVTDGSVP